MPSEPEKGRRVDVAVLDLLWHSTLCYNPPVPFGDRYTCGNNSEDFYSPRKILAVQVAGSVVEDVNLGKITSLKNGHGNGHAVVCACPDAVYRSSKSCGAG